MTDPKPYPQRPQSNPRPKPRPAEPRPAERSRTEWQTFSALPPPAARLEVPEPEPETDATDPLAGPKLASWQKRIGAFALDFGLGLGVSYVAQGIAAMVGTGAEAVNFVGYGAFFTTWLVNRGYFQSQPAGQSLGKWLLNIKTIDKETEQSPSLIRSVAREGVTSLLVLTESLVVPLGADALFAVFDKEKRQTLHDRAGRTQVVEAEKGYDLDEKVIQWLEEVSEGEAADDIKAAAQNLLAIARRNETIADLSDQIKRLRKDIGLSSGSAADQAYNRSTRESQDPRWQEPQNPSPSSSRDSRWQEPRRQPPVKPREVESRDPKRWDSREPLPPRNPDRRPPEPRDQGPRDPQIRKRDRRTEDWGGESRRP